MGWFRKEWKRIYDSTQGYVREKICGKNVAIRLIHPNKLIEFWKGDCWQIRKKYFGIGGNDYVDDYLKRYRLKLKLSIEVYCKLGCKIPFEMKEYYESLASMDVHDALYYYQKTKI